MSQPSPFALPPALAELQARVEALFVANRALEAEVLRLRAQAPLLCVRPRRLPLPLRVALRLLPPLRRARETAMIRRSGLLDAAWYLARYPDVAASGADPARHYLLHGAAERRDPGPHFSTGHYLSRYPDIEALGLNPLVHYLVAGWDEGRSIRPDMPHRRRRAA